MTHNEFLQGSAPHKVDLVAIDRNGKQYTLHNCDVTFESNEEPEPEPLKTISLSFECKGGMTWTWDKFSQELASIPDFKAKPLPRRIKKGALHVVRGIKRNTKAQRAYWNYHFDSYQLANDYIDKLEQKHNKR